MMRRALSGLLAVVILVCALTVFPISASAGSSFREGDFDYKIDDYGELCITGYFGSSTDVVIPEDVSCIGEFDAPPVFSGLTSITLNRSVYFIPGSIDNCPDMRAVYIPDLSFWCDMTYTTTESNPLYFAHNLYINGELAENISIPDTVKEIVPAVFAYCKCMKSVAIPKSVKGIYMDAFKDCSALKDVYYAGSENEWNKIAINETGNEYLLNATIHFNSSMPEERLPFDLEKDANSFWHYNDETVANAGFKRRTDYSLDKKYYTKLLSVIGRKAFDVSLIAGGITGTLYAGAEISSLKQSMKQNWGGSCFGTSMTMAKLYNGGITINDLTDRKAACYYDLDLPCDNPKLDNAICYYQLSKGIIGVALTMAEAKVKSSDSGDKLMQFLKQMVNYAKKDDVYVLGYNYKILEEEKGGHAILIIDYWFDGKTAEHVVKLYDLNSVPDNNISKTATGEFSEMRISEDFTSFRVVGTGDKELEHYTEMKIVDPNSYLSDEMLPSSAGNLAASGADEICVLKIDADTPVEITDSEGNTLTCDDYETLGDITVYAEDYIGDENGVVLNLILPDDTYTITPLSEKVNCIYYNSENYMSINADSIESVGFDRENGMDISGNDYSFEAFISTKEEVNEYGENNLVEITGNAASNVNLSSTDTDVVIDTDSVITDVTVSNMIDNQQYSEDLGTISENTSVPRLLLDYGDADGDGAITIMDATLIQRYLAVLTNLPEKQLLAADADADDAITVLDATMIQRFLADLVDRLGV